MLDSIGFSRAAQGAEAKAVVFSLPRGCSLVGLSKSVNGKSATVTANTLDLNVGTEAKLSAVCPAANDGDYVFWKSTHFGGSQDPIDLPKDTEISIDVNHTGAGNLDIDIIVHFAWGEV